MSAYKDRRHKFAAAGLVAALHIAALTVLVERRLSVDATAVKTLAIYFSVPVAHPSAKPAVMSPAQPTRTSPMAERAKRKLASSQEKQAVATIVNETPQKNADAATHPAAEDAPKLNMSAMIEQAKGMDSRRTISGLDRLHESERPHGTLEEKFGTSVARATREDCRTKYVSPTPSLLLLIPLAIETITDKGCKW